MNEDEALKCYDIAKAAVKLENYDKAEKFLVKSIKLHETEQAQVLLQRLDYLRRQNEKKNHEPAAPNPAAQLPKKEDKMTD